MFMMIDDDQADHGQDYDQNLEDNYDDGCHGHEQGYKELRPCPFLVRFSDSLALAQEQVGWGT